eukprot:2609953-Pleurochrysis_carterae.AAC.2
MADAVTPRTRALWRRPYAPGWAKEGVKLLLEKADFAAFDKRLGAQSTLGCVNGTGRRGWLCTFETA